MLFFYYIIFHGQANNLAPSGQKLTHSLQKNRGVRRGNFIIYRCCRTPRYAPLPRCRQR